MTSNFTNRAIQTQGFERGLMLGALGGALAGCFVGFMIGASAGAPPSPSSQTALETDLPQAETPKPAPISEEKSTQASDEAQAEPAPHKAKETAPIEPGNAGTIAELQNNIQLQLSYFDVNHTCIKNILENTPLNTPRNQIADAAYKACLPYVIQAKRAVPVPTGPSAEDLERKLVSDAMHDTFGD